MDLSKHKKARWLARQIIEAWESKSPSVDDTLSQSESEDVDGVPCKNILTEDIVDFIRRRDAEGLNDALQILDIEKGDPELLLPCEFLRTVDGRPFGFVICDKASRQSRKRELAKAIESFASPKPTAGAAAKPAKQKPKRGDAQSLCIASLVKHPHWTNKQIAAHVGINPATITKARMPQFFNARRAASGTSADLPRGAKACYDDGDDGHLEATYREDGGVNSMPSDDD